MTARDVILERIRSALKDVPHSEPAADVAIAWSYGQPTPLADVLERFVENILDYGARIVRVSEAEVPSAISRALIELDASVVVVPPGAPESWAEAMASSHLTLLRDAPMLTHAQLDAADAVVTGSAVSMAETGTIALDHGPGQGRRALSLIPDRHVCVVRAESVVSDVAEAVAALRPTIQSRPVTWISGGSATSDIELSRVEGVHGPRQLFVVLAE